MRVPEVPNVSLRFIAAKRDFRVFSSAQMPVNPLEPSEASGSPEIDVVAVMTVLGSLSWLPCEPG